MQCTYLRYPEAMSVQTINHAVKSCVLAQKCKPLNVSISFSLRVIFLGVVLNVQEKAGCLMRYMKKYETKGDVKTIQYTEKQAGHCNVILQISHALNNTFVKLFSLFIMVQTNRTKSAAAVSNLSIWSVYLKCYIRIANTGHTDTPLTHSYLHSMFLLDILIAIRYWKKTSVNI